jgi:hypothetical protein
MDGIPHLTIGYQLRGESQMQVYEGWSPSHELSGPQYGELTISMEECKGLVLVTLTKIKRTKLIKRS